MFNCTNNKLPNDMASGNKKPIVLSSQRYEKILNHSHAENERVQKEAAEEQKYREYLKKGNDELMEHFKGTIKRTQDQKMEQIKVQAENKFKQVLKSHDQAKENEQIVRREKIAKAQALIDKLKPGPRELHSAVLQSEVLRARNVQRNINEEFEKAIKLQECNDKLACEKQTGPWVQEEQERIADRQKRTNNYKNELLQTINENSKHRSDYKKQLIKEQQAAREAMDQEIKTQIEKEKAIMEKKRAALRKNALEAMKMVEQRRLRERMTDEIEDRLCCTYNVGKLQLDTLKVKNSKQIAADREKAVESNAKFIASLQTNMQVAEAERLRRDISRMQLKFTAEEQEKIRKDKAAKQARIEAYFRELQQQKEAKQRAAEEKRFEMAQRFKNTEINCLFTEAQKQERLRQVQEVRAKLKEQTDDLKRAAEHDEKEELRVCAENNNDKEDKFFFEYARNLMEDAQKKNRPLYPFAKVVQQYKRDHQIDCERKTPKHLISHLNIGIRQPGDSKAAEKKANTSPEKGENPQQVKREKTDKESILENCLKITELLVASSGGDDDKCKAETLPECMMPSTKRSKGLTENCHSVASSEKLTYSVHELKSLNQFASVHH